MSEKTSPNRMILSGVLKTKEKKTIEVTLTSKEEGNYQGKLRVVQDDYFTTQNFDYTGAVQTFNVPISGTYKIEAWGASGTKQREVSSEGLGAYVNGMIFLEKDTNLYLYVGKSYDWAYGFNGAGYSTEGWAYAGGGATDIRLISGLWNNFDSLKSRIMVAAGGGSSEWYGSIGGAGGGLIGETGYGGSWDSNDVYTDYNITATGGTQTSGGIATIIDNYGWNGGFGYAGYTTLDLDTGGMGGGGYYGGGSMNAAHGGGGGSSFISGHDGCDAIKENSTKDNIIHTGQNIHYSGLYFTNTVMIDGNGYNWTNTKGSYIGMPTHDGLSTMTGNSGDGYAKITLLE